MARHLLLGLFAMMAGGCTLLFGPERDFTRDAGMDAGPTPVDGGVDAGPDAGADAGFDAGPDAGCQPTDPIETDCDNGEDEDCNGLVDCNDFACAASPDCCADDPMMGDGMPFVLPPYSAWFHDGESMLPRHPETDEVEFGSAAYPQAIVYQDACVPLAYGLDLDLSFAVNMDTRGDYAALKLSPIDDRMGGTGPYLSELTVRVIDSGEVRLERAGAVVRSVTIGGSPILVQISLRPGLDAANRGVVLVTVEAGGMPLATAMPFMPFSDLRGAPTCSPDGLFLVLEGQGPNVTVSSNTNARQYACENPSQFLPDTTGLPSDLSSEFEPDTTGWRTGGLGEPAVLHVSLPPERLEIWADAARIERSDELLRFIDFTIGATRQQLASWTPRLINPGSSPNLLGPSAREPSIGVPINAAGQLPGGNLLIAYALKRPTADLYDLRLATVATGEPVSFTDDQELMKPIDVECDSLRDPSVAVLGENPFTDGILIFYTCEKAGAPDRVGVARFGYSAPNYTMETFNNDLLTQTLGSYAARGVFSPEAIVIPDAMEPMSPSIRLWFLTRDNAGRVAMSTAFGEIPVTKRLPVLSPYPGNPILRADEALLGGDCSIGCTLDAVGVTRTIPGGRWSDPSYLLVVAQSRQTVTGVEHALVPILQPRPAGE